MLTNIDRIKKKCLSNLQLENEIWFGERAIVDGDGNTK